MVISGYTGGAEYRVFVPYRRAPLRNLPAGLDRIGTAAGNPSQPQHSPQLSRRAHTFPTYPSR